MIFRWEYQPSLHQSDYHRHMALDEHGATIHDSLMTHIHDEGEVPHSHIIDDGVDTRPKGKKSRQVNFNAVGIICPECGHPITVQELFEFQKTLMLQMALSQGKNLSEKDLEELANLGRMEAAKVVERQLEILGEDDFNAQQ